MATGGQDNIKEKCICPICLEILKSPKRLPCLHTFCELCIQEFLSSTQLSGEGESSNYLCPICRAVIFRIKPELHLSQWVSLLPDTPITSKMADSKRKENGHECDTCSRQNIRSEAKLWCQDCRDSFCDECIKLHKVMKFSADHTVVQISQISKGEQEINLSVISDSCPVHKSKRVEAYCFDHKQILCVLCLTLKHRKCDNVQAIEEIPAIKKDVIEKFQKDLTRKENATDKMLQESKQDEERLVDSFVEIKNTATQTVQSMKDKLDELLVSFKKELELKQDEYKLKQQTKTESLKTLLENIQSINSATNLVNNYGSSVQLFVHLEKSKSEIELEMREAIMQLKKTNNVEIKFVDDDILRQINQKNRIGNISISEITDNTVIEFASVCFSDSIMGIQLSRKRTIYLPGYQIRGGVCISSKSLILCTASCKLIEFNLDDGKVIQEYIVCHNPKRIAYDPKTESFLVSCYDNCLLLVLYNNRILSHNAIKSNGGVCMHSGYFYAIVGMELMKLSDSSSKLLTKCFQTDTDCSGLNALAVDPSGKRFMYTTKDFRVRCISVDGKELFCFNDTEMKKINSLAVSARGLTFVGGETGSIHVISENGEKMKMLRPKCVNIQNLSDIWLDESGKTLYVCGDEYIEFYDIL